jgi:site-specific DNA-methyltransferase (adenine-specific)
MGFGKVYLERNVRRVHKPEGTLWVTGTHHIVFSLGFANQRLGYRIIKVAS